MTGILHQSKPYMMIVPSPVTAAAFSSGQFPGQQVILLREHGGELNRTGVSRGFGGPPLVPGPGVRQGPLPPEEGGVRPRHVLQRGRRRWAAGRHGAALGTSP